MRPQIYCILTSNTINKLVNRTVRLDIKIRQKKSLMSKTQGLKKSNDLLSRKTSTISAIGLNFSVRNGKRWTPMQ